MTESDSVTYIKDGKEFTRRKRRIYSDEFKLQVVRLFSNGKPKREICEEYEVTGSALDRWIKQFNNSGSLGIKNNLTPEESELANLRKELRRLRMENDILKQAALILGRRVKH